MRRTAIVFACAAAAITKASAYTVTATITSPVEVTAGETATITLNETNAVFDTILYNGIYWEATPWFNRITIYDGIGNHVAFNDGGVGATHAYLETSWSVPVTYLDAGTYFPHFEVDITYRLYHPGAGLPFPVSPPYCEMWHEFCIKYVDFTGDFSTSLTVSTPISNIGTGFPGLLLCAGWLFTYRRLSNSSRPTVPWRA